MNIVILSQYYFPEIGAAANRWTEYSELMAEMGHDITVICGKPNYPTGKLYDGYKNKKYEIRAKYNLKIIRTWVYMNSRDNNMKRMAYFISFMMSSMIAGIKLLKPDLLIASSPPLFVGISGWLLSKYHKVPLISDIRDLWPESAIELGELNSKVGKMIGFYMQKIVYNQTLAFIASVPGFKDHLKKNIYSKDKLVIPLLNGIGDNIINQCQGERSYCFDTINIIYAGNIGLAQNLDILLSAAKILDNKYQFKIIGYGVKKDKLVSHVETNNLQNVTFIPPLSRAELVSEYNKSHIGIVCLNNNKLFKYAIPSKTFEYMAVGLAVFCLVKGEIEDIIKKSKAGICIDPDDEKMLISAFKNISEKELQKMGRSGKQYVRRNLRKRDLIQNAMGEIEPILKNNKY